MCCRGKDGNAEIAASRFDGTKEQKDQKGTDPAQKRRDTLRTLLMTALGIVILAVVIVLFVTLLHGDFSWVGQFSWFQNLADLLGTSK